MGVPAWKYNNASQETALYQAHLLEQYKTYLAMADKISDRRSTANTFFLTVNSGLLGALGFAKFTAHEVSSAFIILACLAALPVCYTWYRLIRSYRDLNSAKFKVVHQIERLLPLRPFDAEWEAVGGGLNPHLYKPFTEVEKVVPWIYMALYIGLMLYVIYTTQHTGPLAIPH
ncbi:MAG: hypothetical protein JST22_20710 [Bacteroidetes bacterium]|nr:hypothetical protein [Bacteroidota bacterium]